MARRKYLILIIALIQLALFAVLGYGLYRYFESKAINTSYEKHEAYICSYTPVDTDGITYTEFYIKIDTDTDAYVVAHRGSDEFLYIPIERCIVIKNNNLLPEVFICKDAGETDEYAVMVVPACTVFIK